MSKSIVRFEDLINIEPITKNQEKAFESWQHNEKLSTCWFCWNW